MQISDTRSQTIFYDAKYLGIVGVDISELYYKNVIIQFRNLLFSCEYPSRRSIFFS